MAVRVLIAEPSRHLQGHFRKLSMHGHSYLSYGMFLPYAAMINREEGSVEEGRMQMVKLNSTHMIEEICDNVRTGDLMKARLVLSHIGDVDGKTRNRLVYELSRGEVEFSTPLLLFLIDEHPDVLDSMPVIRETLLSNMVAYPEMLLQFLDDPSLPGKKELVRIAAELRLNEAAPVLIGMASNTTDEKEILLIIEALGDIGNPDAVPILTEFLYAGKNELSFAAARSLGMIGTPAAMQRLAERMGADNEIDLLILSLFAEVQDSVSLEKLNETLASHYAHKRTFAKKELVKIGPKAVPFLIADLEGRAPDFLVHTLNVLGDIGDESAVLPVRKLLQNQPENANVRFAAYEALALLPLRKGAYTLTAGLTDAEEHVCIAAARAIERNFSDILAAGIKNLLRGMGADAHHIARTIIDSHADKIFLSLAEEDFFQELALSYLPLTHRDTQQHYHDVLVSNGWRKFAEKVAGTKVDTGSAKIVAVDDSRMILNIYKTTLHQLGFDPVVFQYPAEAIEWLQDEKPLLVLTDLNMPDITGIQLAEEIRKKYSHAELPVIMVTTQNEANDNEAAIRAGVDKIIHKPFNGATLRQAMAEYLDAA